MKYNNPWYLWFSTRATKHKCREKTCTLVGLPSHDEAKSGTKNVIMYFLVDEGPQKEAKAMCPMEDLVVPILVLSARCE